MGLDYVQKKGITVIRADYDLIYTAPLTEKDTLDVIYERFNIQRPADFTGHSLSVSDVVVLNDGSTVKAYYVDSIGFAELPEFFKERNMDLQKETLLNEELQEIEIFDKPGLFSNGRLRDEDVPEGLYRYDLRGSDYDPGQPITVEKTVVVNHAASVLMAEELDLGAEGRLELGEEGLNFTGAELTVREFMEEQQQKSNALIYGDSDHIAVEGHIGTWYAIDETEVGGEKFFLLEHEEHGDMAACVAVNEQGKLVAEDLWNGFDEDFQEAVQKYFSEKWNMPKKEDVVSEIIEKATPVPDNSAQDYSDVPVYYEPFSYAKENDEVDLYRTSYRLNSECKQAIHEAIADNYDGMYLGDDAVDQVVRQYGMERVGYILANTLHHKSYDDRFSHSNKEWAEQVSTPEHDADRMTFRIDWVVDSHPAILDGFVKMFRKELEAQKKLEQEQPFVKQFYVVENLQAAPSIIERFDNLDDAMSHYQALPNHYMKALGVEKNPDPLPGSLDILQCRNGIDTIVEDYKTVPGWDNPYIQNHVVQPLQGALSVQDVELAYELPDAYFHIQTGEDGFDYTLYNKDFTERDGGVLETDGDKSVQEAMTELLAAFGCDAAEGKVMDAAELREQADTVAEQQAEVLKEKLAAERPAPEETLSFYVAECLEFTFAGEFHDHLTMEEALEVYDKIPSERMNADKCIGFCIEEDGGFVGMYELVVNDKVQRENINSINYFRDDKLVQQAISDMEKLMAARQQSKEQERGSTKKSVLDALRSLKAKKQEQPAQEQDKPKKAKKKGMDVIVSNLVNTMYCRDAGKKLRTANQVKWRKGITTASAAPFGYQFDPDKKGAFIVDPPAAKIVRRIFDLAILGLGTREIAMMLNDENVPVPSVYNKENKAYGKETTYTIAPVILWDSSRVWKILTAYVYTGAMVLGKTKTLISGKSIVRTVPKGQQFITEGTHEAIVGREEFEKAQLVIKSNSHKVLMGGVDFPLKGKVRCGNCRRVMAHNFKQAVPTFWCREGLELVGQTQCTSEVFQVSDIENAVFQALKKELSLLDVLYGDIQKEEQGLKEAHKKASRRKTLMEQELKNLKGEKMRMYEEYAAGTLLLDTYKQKKQECDRRISEVQEQIEQSKVEESTKSVVPGTVRAAAEQAENFLNGTRLTASMVSAFIENVFVYDGGRIVVRFKYEQSIQDAVKALHTG